MKKGEVEVEEEEVVRDGDRQVDKQTGTGLLLLAGRLMVMVTGACRNNANLSAAAAWA